jgi:hypothetical protein
MTDDPLEPLELFPAPPWFGEIWEEFVAASKAAPERQATAPPNPAPAKPRRQRRTSLASVAKQANKAALEVARYEVKPDGTVVIVTGKSEPTEASNPWLDDLKVTKQ